MKIKFLLFILIYAVNLSAQQYGLRAVYETNSDSLYNVILQIKMEKSEELNLGNATIRFSYDANKLTFPDLPVEGIDYTFNLKGLGQYLCSITKPKKGEISVNIFFKKGSPKIITDKYYSFVSIKFCKKTEFGNFKINEYTAEIFSPNKQKPWQLYDFSLGYSKDISSENMQ